MPDPLPYHSRTPDSTPAAHRICPKCNSPMAEGFLLDRQEGGPAQCTWVDGFPEKHKLFGMVTVPMLKTKGRIQIPVITYRCNNCGYLESYAHTNM